MKSRILLFFAIASIGIAGCSDPCDDVNCLNGGACNDGTCVCTDGFTGEFCQNTVDPCEDINCLNGGTCNDGSCLCPQGFSGEFCQTVEPCAGVNCLNGGACDNGVCDCPQGYTGSDCGTEVRAAFIGTYLVTHSCMNNTCPTSHTVVITADPTGIMKITLSDLCSNWTVPATIQADGVSFIIPQTTVSNPFYASGSGVLNGPGIALSMSFNGWGTVNCPNMQMTRQ